MDRLTTDSLLQEPCADCGALTDAQCDQCLRPICERHQEIIISELGRWTRCQRCITRNVVRESPIVTGFHRAREVGEFFRVAWFLVWSVFTIIGLLYAWLRMSRVPR